jgi:hypothetical protein
MPIKCTCTKCGKPFVVKPYAIKSGGGKYCSIKCYHNAQIIRVERVCVFCGKTFEARAEQIRLGHGKYCSKKCDYMSRTKQVECVCLTCGKAFKIGRGRFNRGNGKYCSKKCRGIANRGKARTQEERNKVSEGVIRYFDDPNMRKRQSAAQKKRFEDTWWYGSVNYHDAPKYCEKWTSDLRERVRAYFGYVCFECGTPQGKTKLHVHHVWYNKAMCCDNTPRTLVPLCKSCHLKTNYKREYWSLHFQELIDTRHKGKCWLTREEMKRVKKECKCPKDCISDCAGCRYNWEENDKELGFV